VDRPDVGPTDMRRRCRSRPGWLGSRDTRDRHSPEGPSRPSQSPGVGRSGAPPIGLFLIETETHGGRYGPCHCNFMSRAMAS
jgi:hypothetical protein